MLNTLTSALPVKAGILLLLLMSQSPTAQAQSVDSCMTARLADALTICQSILDSGSRNADVYWKLSSAQYQDGQKELANKTLSDALRLHPGNAKLQTLRDIIASNSAEQALIARSAQLNQSSIDKGAMKIACLTKTGDLAISACERRLELTDVDGERIRTRLATLEKAQAEARLATAPVARAPEVEPVASAPEPDPVTPIQAGQQTTIVPIPVVSEPTPEQLAAEARRVAYTTLVAEVQTRLNDFGLTAGLPDGVPGARTRQALQEFYNSTGMPAVTSISDVTLEDLIAARGPFELAQSQLEESRLALTDGNVLLAVQKLDSAKRTSGLVQVPASLETDIQSRLTAERSNPAPIPAPVTPDPVTNPAPTPAPNPVSNPGQSTVSAGVEAPQDFDALMSQIRTLTGKIQRQQSDREQQLNDLRDAL